MTENEAMEWLAEETSPMKIHIAAMNGENPMEYINEAVKVACHALEEIQQYRAIGLTPTMIKDLISMNQKHHKSALENAHIVDEYQAIGTIEEIKEKLSLFEKYEELGTVEELDEVLNMFC